MSDQAMSARRLGVRLTWLLALCLLSAELQPARRVTATMSAQASNPANVLAAATLGAPSSLTATPTGHDVQLAWGAGQNGNGYTVLGAANGLSSNCASASLSALTTSSTTSVTDSGRYLPQGTFYCYEVRTTYGPWNSLQGNPRAAAQIGFVASTVQMVNAGNTSGCSGTGAQQSGQAGVLDCGDQIIITFNQAVDTATGPSGSNSICVNDTADIISLGATGTGPLSCQLNESVLLGRLTGGAVGLCLCRFAASYAWSSDNRTITVTVGAETFPVLVNLYPTISAATWTLAPTTTTTALLSASGSFHVCDTNTGGGNCLPATAGGSTFIVAGPAVPTATAPPAPVPSATTAPTAAPTLVPPPTPTAKATPSVSAKPATPTATSIPAATPLPKPSPSHAPARPTVSPPPPSPSTKPVPSPIPPPAATMRPTPSASATTKPTR